MLGELPVGARGKRDAEHVATIIGYPKVGGLRPGNPVIVDYHDGGLYLGNWDDYTGIIDPFLDRGTILSPNDFVLVIIHPNCTENLTHQWDFSENSGEWDCRGC